MGVMGFMGVVWGGDSVGVCWDSVGVCTDPEFVVFKFFHTIRFKKLRYLHRLRIKIKKSLI